MTAWHLGVRVGSFQNPGVCLQAFPSFPSPSPRLLIALFIALQFFAPEPHRKIYRPDILCSRTAQKRLLHRLLHSCTPSLLCSVTLSLPLSFSPSLLPSLPIRHLETWEVDSHIKRKGREVVGKFEFQF